MKKLFLSLVAAIVAATATYAQSTLVATLSHGENITMYYGAYALRDAVNAAESGDVINLSGGGFQAVDITKAVTLRGVGINATVPTSINSTLNVNIPSTDVNRFSMEGIRCNEGLRMIGSFENPYFLKCWFTNVSDYESSSAIKNALFVNCRITGGSSFYGSTLAQFVNCYISSFNNYSENPSASFVNCVVGSGTGVVNHIHCQFVNCIFYKNGYTGGTTLILPTTSIATNCIAITPDMSRLFNGSQVNPNCGYADYSQVFKNFRGSYSDSQTFELSEEGKATYLGNDGTEVGMYGGVMPYNPIPSYPLITKMNVANHTTADGKLNVEIEVSAAE